MTSRSAQKDYDILARAVACEYCRAAVGEPCRGASGHTKSTHSVRRRLAAKQRAAQPGVWRPAATGEAFGDFMHRQARECAGELPRPSSGGETMKIQMTMILECDDDALGADFGKAVDAAKNVLRAGGFRVHGLRLTPVNKCAEPTVPLSEEQPCPTTD